jgi:AcrR family transcriptional regulator
MMGGPSRQARGDRSPRKEAAAQRRALTEAMARLVAERGYRGVGTTSLAREARVSKAALYERFGGVEGCFAALHDQAVEEAAARVEEGCGNTAGVEDGLQAGVASFAGHLASDRPAARAVLLAAPELGRAGLARRRRAAARFEATLARRLAGAGERPPLATARAIVAGVAAVARRRLREGGTGEPPLPARELSRWAIGLAAAEDEAGLRAALATRARRRPGGEGEAPWSESPRSRRSRRALARRERFVRGAAWVAAARGAGALSIPAVSYAAASSNEAFYRCFAGAEEALLAAFEELQGRAAAALGEGPPPAPTLAARLAAALAALRGDLATGFFLPRLAFVELPALGPAGARRAEEGLDELAAVLIPASPGAGRVAREAEVGALWGLVEGALVGDARA